MPIIAPHRKRRRPTLQRVIEEARKAGKPVKEATITAEAVTVVFGEPDGECKDTPERILSQL
jgi:hypothetical protein